MPLTTENAALLRNLVDSFIKKDDTDVNAIFAEYSVAKTKEIMEGSGDPKSEQGAEDVKSSIKRPSEIKGSAEGKDPKAAKGAEDVKASIKRPKEIKGSAEGKDPKAAKGAEDVKASIKRPTEIK